MDIVIFIIGVYTNVLMCNHLLFRGKIRNRFSYIYLVLFILNLVFTQYLVLFVVLIYVLQCYFVYLLVNNFYLVSC
ncbi:MULTISPECIES: hypothetical protein [unclassified Enterococcus]|jgi:hypothetical protein|uniref:hypothetical protein n=1 Tax=unclassified Enterococcus TaxID=2608891 RepID=UPI003D29CA1A